jgi:hypothetical protein
MMCGCTETTDCYRHELMARSVPPKDWKLLTVHDRGPGHYYRFAITGLNLNWRPEARDYRFSWSVPSIDDPRYDTSEAIFTSVETVNARELGR